MRIFKTNSLIALLLLVLSLPAFAGDTGPVTGLPMPRFVILKSQETNLRKGPDIKYPIVWVYKQKGYPMEVVAEFENWRKLRDSDGAEGWVHENLITGTRNVRITGNNYISSNMPYSIRDNELILFHNPDESSYPKARLQFGAIGKLKKCQVHWCQAKFENTIGWVHKSNLWGVYPNEAME